MQSSYVLWWFPRSTRCLYYPGASVPVKRLPLPRDSRLHPVLYPNLIPFPTDALSLPGSSPQSCTAMGCPVSLNSSGLFLRPSLVFVTLTAGRCADQIFCLCIFQLSVSIWNPDVERLWNVEVKLGTQESEGPGISSL